MRKIILIKLIIFGLLISSCKPNSENRTRKITYYHYYLSWFPSTDRRDLKSKHVIYLDTVVHHGETNYIYHDSLVGGDTLTIQYSVRNDSLYYFDVYCKVIDTIQFDFNNKSITLYQSDYDEESSYDEESDIYWNNSYGIIGIYNHTGPLELFDHESIKSFTTDNLYKFITKKIRERTPPIPENNKDLK